MQENMPKEFIDFGLDKISVLLKRFRNIYIQITAQRLNVQPLHLVSLKQLHAIHDEIVSQKLINHRLLIQIFTSVIISSLH